MHQYLFLQYDAEFRRFSVDKNKMKEYEGFEKLLSALHNIDPQSFVITYTDTHGDLLPINNNENFQKALSTAKPLLRIMVQMKGDIILLIRINISFLKFRDKNEVIIFGHTNISSCSSDIQ